MDQCNPSRRRFVHLRKLIPLFVLAGLAALAGGTDIFSAGVRIMVSGWMSAHMQLLKAYAGTVFAVAAALYVAWVVYGWARCWALGLVQRWSPREDLRSFTDNTFRLAYWLVVVYFTVAFFAPDLMGKLGQGMLFFFAALGVALQNQVGDLFCGLLLRMPDASRQRPLLAEGDMVKLKTGEDAEGIVVEIGYMRSVIQCADGPNSIRNSVIWAAKISHPMKPAEPPVTNEPAPPASQAAQAPGTALGTAAAPPEAAEKESDEIDG